MLPAAFVTTPPPASSHPPHRARRLPAVERERADRRFEAGDLYSLRARRRFATYLRLRLLELREEHLERAADVIERRLPIDDLVPDLAAPQRSDPDPRR